MTTKNFNEFPETKNFKNEEKERDFLKEDIVFIGKNGEYEIKHNDYISCGGESLLYFAKKRGSDEKLIAKIYDQTIVSSENNRIRKKVNEFIMKNSDYKKSHLLPIYDYGIVAMNISDSDGEDIEVSRYVDIVPYSEKGNLDGKKMSFSFLQQKVVPSILEGMNSLHKAGFIHRDIKPENICYFGEDNVIVLSDFGIATEVNEGVSVGFTQLRRGTVGYSAPEIQGGGYAGIPADYFSLGATLATLYNGKPVYDLNDNKIGLKINRNGFPVETKTGDESLQSLINALTNPDESMRAGYDVVLKWTKDKDSIGHILYNETRNEVRPLNIEGTKCTTPEEIANALIINWNFIKRYIYPFGGQRIGIVEKWLIDNNYNSLAIQLRDIIEEKETAINMNLGVSKAMFYMLNKNSFIWDGHIFNSLEDLGEWVRSEKTDKTKVHSLLSSGYLSFVLEETEGVSDETTKEIKELEKTAREYPEVAYYYATYTLPSKEKTVKTYNGCKSVDEVFSKIINENNEFYLDFDKYLKDPEFIGFVSYKTNLERVVSWVKNYNADKENEKNYELAYVFFEMVSENQKKVRRHYMEHGPKSYIFWLLDNLSMYKGVTPRGKRLISELSEMTVSDETSLANMAETTIKTLDEKYKDFVCAFNNNPLAMYMGFEEGDIISYNPDAFFKELYMDIKVPIGYMNSKR